MNRYLSITLAAILFGICIYAGTSLFKTVFCINGVHKQCVVIE